MKRSLVIVAMLLTCASGTALARRIQWNPREKRPVLLQEALEIAETELGKKDAKFHCIGASLAKTFSNGDWELQYGSAEGELRWVSVGSDKKVRVSAAPFEY